jgi:hypothetical protein
MAFTEDTKLEAKRNKASQLTLLLLFLVVLPVVGLAWLGSALNKKTTPGETQTTPSPTPSRDIVHSGEIGVLRAGDSSSGVLLGSSREAYDEITKIAVSHDQEGLAMLVLSERAFAVPAGTKVRVLGRIGFLSTGTEVRILEGDRYGRVGFVPSEWVVPVSSVESATPEIRKAKPVLSASPKGG